MFNTATMKGYTYVDNSNVFIEGQRNFAVTSGKARDLQEATRKKIFDYSWNIDYGKLHEFVCGSDADIGCAKLWGSPPPEDSFWEMVRRQGFDVKTYDRKFGKEKKVDTAIAHQITKDAYTIIDKLNSEIFLVAGDADYEPVVSDLVSGGFNVVVVFWDNVSAELRTAASRFISLNPYIWHLRV